MIEWKTEFGMACLFLSPGGDGKGINVGEEVVVLEYEGVAKEIPVGIFKAFASSLPDQGRKQR